MLRKLIFSIAKSQYYSKCIPVLIFPRSMYYHHIGLDTILFFLVSEQLCCQCLFGFLLFFFNT